MARPQGVLKPPLQPRTGRAQTEERTVDYEEPFVLTDIDTGEQIATVAELNTWIARATTEAEVARELEEEQLR